MPQHGRLASQCVPLDPSLVSEWVLKGSPVRIAKGRQGNHVRPAGSLASEAAHEVTCGVAYHLPSWKLEAHTEVDDVPNIEKEVFTGKDVETHREPEGDTARHKRTAEQVAAASHGGMSFESPFEFVRATGTGCRPSDSRARTYPAYDQSPIPGVGSLLQF